MSLKAWRAALATAVGGGLGVTVYPWNAGAIDPPCALIDPGTPYLSTSDDDDVSFAMHTLRWSVWLVVRGHAEAASLDELDDLIDGILPAVAAAAPPDGGARPTVERVDAPSLLDIGGTQYLVAHCTVSTLRPN